MALYVGIDLHANTSVVVVLDAQDRVVYQKRLPNALEHILEPLAPYRAASRGVVVESTYNWYWLVDGLMEAGYVVHLANTAAIQQYDGLKHTDDRSDARWLAHLLRLGLLPQGHIYPEAERPVRDLLRKRRQLVRHQTAHRLSIQNLVARNTGASVSGNRINHWERDDVLSLVPDADRALAVTSNLAVLHGLADQMAILERTGKERVKLRPAFRQLLTGSGIGDVLALTILLETGEIGRFATVGDFASDCRCVGSHKLSHGTRTGQGHTKNGNKYVAWAFVEAANFAVRYNPQSKRYYQRQQAKTNGVVAIKAVAHKVARAGYDVMRDQVPFETAKAFG
jgi:transposase